MEKLDKYTKDTVTTGWTKTTKEGAGLAGKMPLTNKVAEEKIVSRLTFEPDPQSQVSFNTYQAILDRRNQMLGTVKPNSYQYDAE